MKILVTGGAGFIGSNFVKFVLGAGSDIQVRVIDDLSTGFSSNLDGLDIEFVNDSILNEHALRESVEGVDSIVHLAAIPSVPRSIADPRRSHDANATGTLNVLEAARVLGVGHLIVASSSSVYGSNPLLPKPEDTWTRPMSPYAATKLLTESYALAYGSSFGMSTLAFRFFNVYGPGQAAGHAYAAVIPQFLDHALRDLPIPLNGDGTQTRDFTYVGSVCAALLAAIEQRLSHDGPVNLAFGTNTSLLELIEVIAADLGRELAVESRPPRTGDVYASRADSSLMTRLFPTVQPVPLVEGVARTIEWFRREYGVAAP